MYSSMRKQNTNMCQNDILFNRPVSCMYSKQYVLTLWNKFMELCQPYRINATLQGR